MQFDPRIAEFLFPVSTYIAHTGEKHRFRKYLSMGHLGLMEQISNQVLLQASSKHRRIDFDPYHEAIILYLCEKDKMQYQAFDFDGHILFHGKNFENLDELREELSERTKTWKKPK